MAWLYNLEAEIRRQEQLDWDARQADLRRIFSFAEGFLAAIDDDADGGLSMMELRNNKVKTNNEMYHRCAVWLQQWRNFRKYDTDRIGIIQFDDLCKACEEFLGIAWKLED